MHKEFTVEANDKLVMEANKLLESNPSDYSDRLRYHNELSKMVNKILEYKELTFKEVDDFLNDSPFCNNTATVFLNVDLENTINKIFNRQIELFKKDSLLKQVEVKRR